MKRKQAKVAGYKLTGIFLSFTFYRYRLICISNLFVKQINFRKVLTDKFLKIHAIFMSNLFFTISIHFPITFKAACTQTFWRSLVFQHNTPAFHRKTTIDQNIKE